MRGPRNEHVGADSAVPTGPERTCILTGRAAARGALIRLAIAPAGPDGVCEVWPDVLARAPGRGAWIGVSAAELATAQAKGRLKGALARAFKGTKLTIADGLAERITEALTRAFTDQLGLAQRAGAVLTGTDRIAEAARGRRVHWLAHAADAAEDGARRLDQALRVGAGVASDLEDARLAPRATRLPLDRRALSMALGRDNVVHLALTEAAAATRLQALLARLTGFLAPAGAARDNAVADRRTKTDHE